MQPLLSHEGLLLAAPVKEVEMSSRGILFDGTPPRCLLSKKGGGGAGGGNDDTTTSKWMPLRSIPVGKSIHGSVTSGA